MFNGFPRPFRDGGGNNIKSIQRGLSSGLTNGLASAIVTIPAIDTTKSILRFSSTPIPSGTPNADSILVAGVITDSTTLTFSRVGTVGPIILSWEIIEYYAVKSLQTGSFDSVAGSATISTVNLAKSNVFISATCTDNVATNYYLTYSFRISTATLVQVTHYSGTKTYYFQVIEFY